jgi:hypothetical protein
MHTVELLEEACTALKQLGYQVRTEPLEGNEGGVCEFGGRKWLFLDVASPPAEQLQAVLEVLRGEFYVDRIKMSPTLGGLVRFRGAA